MVAFANAVAREVTRTHPGRNVAFDAYLETLDPPPDMRCESNVVVLADSANCMFHSYTDTRSPLARDARLRLEGW